MFRYFARQLHLGSMVRTSRNALMEHARLLQPAQERIERGAKRCLCTPRGSGMHFGFPL
jgi:hypothetical protein